MKAFTVFGVLAAVGGTVTAIAAVTGPAARYRERVLALNFAPVASPGGTWEGITYGLGPNPAEHHQVAIRKNLGVEIKVLSYDEQTDLLTLDVAAMGADGFSLSREVKIKQLQPFTFSNGACAGYVFWHRQENVKPAGYADLEIRGFCP